jgi:hypothetical protein
MWEGYEPALVLYGLFVCHEWRIVRGCRDNSWGEFARFAKLYKMLATEQPTPSGSLYMAAEAPEDPPWLQDKWVLRSHRSNLIRKAPHIYADKYPGTPENMPYLWPVMDGKGGYYLRLSRPDLDRMQAPYFERELPEGLLLTGNSRKGHVIVTPE